MNDDYVRNGVSLKLCTKKCPECHMRRNLRTVDPPESFLAGVRVFAIKILKLSEFLILLHCRRTYCA